MSRKLVLRLGLLAVVAVAGASGVSAFRSRPDPVLAEYPDAPFRPVPADFPRIIPIVDKPPRANKEAYARFHEGRKAVRQFLLEEGAMRRASPDAREAYQAVVANAQFVRGRELALKALKDDPDSVAARFALTVAEHEGEQNFPRALFMIRKIRHQLHQKGLENPDDADAREWYLRVLEREFLILAALDRDEEELRALDLIEQVYQPLPWRRVWPLTKLKRFDEARACLDQAAVGGGNELTVLNSRMVLEGRAHRRKEAYEAGKAAVSVNTSSAVLWANFYRYSVMNFQFADAEEALIRSANCRTVDFWGSPFAALAGHFARGNRMPEAWESLLKAQEQRAAREPYTLVADQDSFARTAAGFLLGVGRSQDALRIARQTVERPGRIVNTMTDRRETTLLNSQFLRAAVWNRLQELDEEHAAADLPTTAPLAERIALEVELRSLERQVIKCVSDDEFLVRLMRPYLPGVPAGVPSHLAGYLPPGVAAEALRRAREQEDHPGAAPYFDAAEAVLAWRKGRPAVARDWSEKALDGLAKDYEMTLRAEMSAYVGEAARLEGNAAAMRSAFDQVLRTAPCTFRSLGLAVPVVISGDGSDLANQAALRILASPRFREHPQGFLLKLRTENGNLTFALHQMDDTRQCSGSVPVAGDPDAVATAACLRLHARLMSPVLDLSPTDVNRLDTSLFAAPASSDSSRLLRLAAGGDVEGR
jgi:tetratricopeptide (TPR) repeat protein